MDKCILCGRDWGLVEVSVDAIRRERASDLDTARYTVRRLAGLTAKLCGPCATTIYPLTATESANALGAEHSLLRYRCNPTGGLTESQRQRQNADLANARPGG